MADAEKGGLGVKARSKGAVAKIGERLGQGGSEMEGDEMIG